jgi:hypothetical protein
VPDGDVGSATTQTAESNAETSEDVTRPDLPPTKPPAKAPAKPRGKPSAAAPAGGVVPGEPIVQPPAEGSDSADPASNGGVPAAAAPARAPRPSRRRGRVIGATGDAEAADTTASTTGNGAAPASDDGAADASAHGNGAAPAAPRRPSMSARLGSVPDAPPDAAEPATTVHPVAPPAPADPTDPVLLVPEVLPSTSPTPRIVPAMPEIVPGVPDDASPQPAPAMPEPEAALYDLAADDPALAFEPPTRVRRRRPRVRRVTRVVRTVDTWSVFKVATVFAAVLYVSALLSGVLLWNVAYATGTIDNAERFMESFGWQTFEFKGGEIFHDAWIIGMFAAAGLVGLTVLAAATFNLVSDLVGGVRVTVLEEEMVVRPVSRRRKQRIRKAPPRAATATAPTADVAAEPGTDLAHRPSNLPTR